jgi:hypothetical protein
MIGIGALSLEPQTSALSTWSNNLALRACSHMYQFLRLKANKSRFGSPACESLELRAVNAKGAIPLPNQDFYTERTKKPSAENVGDYTLGMD